MKYIVILLVFVTLSAHALSPKQYDACKNWPSRTMPMCQRLHELWVDGDHELYLTGFAWHNRYMYPKEKIQRYNEKAWGGGLGKSLYDEKGNWHGIYAFAFLDSHKNVEPIAGYAYLKVAHLNNNLRVGAGLSVFLTSRADILNNIPFPGVLPWVSINWSKATLSTTYIPGSHGTGNVLFILAKWQF